MIQSPCLPSDPRLNNTSLSQLKFSLPNKLVLDSKSNNSNKQFDIKNRKLFSKVETQSNKKAIANNYSATGLSMSQRYPFAINNSNGNISYRNQEIPNTYHVQNTELTHETIQIPVEAVKQAQEAGLRAFMHSLQNFSDQSTRSPYGESISRNPQLHYSEQSFGTKSSPNSFQLNYQQSAGQPYSSQLEMSPLMETGRMCRNFPNLYKFSSRSDEPENHSSSYEAIRESKKRKFSLPSESNHLAPPPTTTTTTSTTTTTYCSSQSEPNTETSMQNITSPYFETRNQYWDINYKNSSTHAAQFYEPRKVPRRMIPSTSMHTFVPSTLPMDTNNFYPGFSSPNQNLHFHNRSPITASQSSIISHISSDDGDCDEKSSIVNKASSGDTSTDNSCRLDSHSENESRLTCGVCQKGLDSNEERKEHAKQHILPSGEFQCCDCFKKFVTIEGLRLHVRKHHEVKKFVCQVQGCRSSFARNCDLRLHFLRRHCDVRPYPCTASDCGKTFASKSELRRHYKANHPEMKIKVE